ncbi:MAG: hypothetical protein Q9M36_01480 [Sulfurovum sp.]|nr:hypothetical protein [Sulfurovum sp.]
MQQTDETPITLFLVEKESPVLVKVIVPIIPVEAILIPIPKPIEVEVIVPPKPQAILNPTPAIVVKKHNVILEEDKEKILEYLLSSLDERDLALLDRDQALEALDLLMKRVLNDRSIAIEEMDKVILGIETQQKRLMIERDKVSQDREINHTQNKGK